MDSKTRIKKMTGYSKNLLTFYLGTERKYAVLDPMLFSKEVCNNYGSGPRSNGYVLIREVLFYGVVQDIANMFFDQVGANPSILNLKSLLDHPEVIQSLKKKYISDHVPVNNDQRTRYDNRRKERAKEFDEYHRELLEHIKTLEQDRELKLCKKIRDKFTAHIDLQYAGGNYSYPDISKYGIKWGTPKRLLRELRPIIISIGWVVRGTSVAWESVDSENNIMATGLWSIKAR